MRDRAHAGFPWLETLLVLSTLALFFQLFPSVWFGLLSALDFRQWSWTVWIVINVILIFGLAFFRGRENA